jgi:hypothetical protein
LIAEVLIEDQTDQDRTNLNRTVEMLRENEE